MMTFLKNQDCLRTKEAFMINFWNRVMFPIMDYNNRVIGFGARVMGDAKPKYLNSPETKLFDKKPQFIWFEFC